MGLKPLLLDTQYRMHPKLAEFPSASFYGGLLQSWPKPKDRPLPPGLTWPNPQVSTASRMLCCAVLCCAVLCCAVLCCAVLCCAVLHAACI